MGTELTIRSPLSVGKWAEHSLVDEWLDHERDANNASPMTVDVYRKGINVFATWANEIPLPYNKVMSKDVVAFKVALSQQYKAQTVNLRLSAVRSFYRYLVNEGKMETNPAREVRGLRRPNSHYKQRAKLANGEVLAVLDTCNEDTPAGLRDKAIIMLMAYCALRQIEIHRANAEDLLTRGERQTLALVGKGRAEADDYAVIPRTIEPTLRAWITCRAKYADPVGPLFVSFSPRNRGGRLSLSAIRAIVTDRYKQAGVDGPHKSTHSLRHSAITNAIRRGVPPLKVQAMARHKSFDTTLGYYHEEGRLEDPAEDWIEYEES